MYSMQKEFKEKMYIMCRQHDNFMQSKRKRHENRIYKSGRLQNYEMS